MEDAEREMTAKMSDDDLAQAVSAIVSGMLRNAMPEHGPRDEASIHDALVIREMRIRLDGALSETIALSEKLATLASGASMSDFAAFCLSHRALQYAVYVDGGKFSMWQGGGYMRSEEYVKFVKDARACGWTGEIDLR